MNHFEAAAIAIFLSGILWQLLRIGEALREIRDELRKR